MATQTLPPLPPGYAEESIRGQVIGTSVLFIVLEVTVVGIRFFSRWITQSRWGWDDFILIPALIACIAQCAITLSMEAYGGLGRHQLAIIETAPMTLVTYAKLQVALTCAYIAAVTLPRLAVIALYLRFFNEKTYRMLCYVLGGVVALFGLLATLITLTMCIPLQNFWSLTPPTSGHCIDINAWFKYGGLPNPIIDVAILLLPIGTVMKLKLANHSKVGLLLTFSAGGIGLLAGLIRIIVFFYIEGSQDGTWTSVKLVIVQLVETSTYLMAACIPGIRPLYLYLRKQGQYSTPKGSKGTSASGSRNTLPRKRSDDTKVYALESIKSAKIRDGDEEMLVRHGRPTDIPRYESSAYGFMDARAPNSIDENRIEVRYDVTMTKSSF